MELNLQDKSVFITASTSGIGKATANAFLREGATVIINGRNEQKLISTLAEFREKHVEDHVYAIGADMSDEQSMKEAVEKVREYVSHIDIVVGNLGTGKPVSEDKFDLKEWHYMFKMNL